MPPIKQETVRLTVYLPPKLKVKLAKQARAEHTSLNALIVRRLLSLA